MLLITVQVVAIETISNTGYDDYKLNSVWFMQKTDGCLNSAPTNWALHKLVQQH